MGGVEHAPQEQGNDTDSGFHKGDPVESEHMFGLEKRRSRQDDDALIEMHFYGDAVDDNAMDVRVLAPALLGLSNALNRYANFIDPTLDLDIKISDVQKGSFGAFLQILGSTANIFQAFNVPDLAKVSTGLLDVIKILAARFRESGNVKPMPREIVKQNSRHVKLKIGSLDLTVDNKTYSASCDGALIHSLGEASHPSTLSGYDDVRFIQPNTGRSEVIGKKESKACSDLVMDDEMLPLRVERTRLQIDTIQMNSRKWKFYDGSDRFWCEIEDESFLRRWDQGLITFSRGDTMDVMLNTEQYLRDGQLCVGRHIITEVFEDTDTFEQPTLDIG